mgnify:CR=1 FL=1
MLARESQDLVLAQRYRLLNKLGAGGMGTVYRAYDRMTGQHVAIKRVNLGANVGNLTVCVSLAREFHLLASLRHPNIIQVSDYGFDEQGQPYYVMTLVDEAVTIYAAGQSRDLVGNIKLILDMLQALVYLHRRNILHRDLKPDNALVDSAGQLRLVDFGLSMEGAVSEEVSGTLAYMPPEALTSDPVSPSSDLYSVGVIAYELLTGKLPFDVRRASVFLRQVITTPPDLTPLETHGALAAVIGRLLAKDPTDRYATASEAIGALCAAVDIPLPEETRGIRESFLGAAKFVGRAAELATLSAALHAKRGSAWLVGGEAGVGKSRLIEEVRIQALVKGVSVMRGQAVEGGGLPCQVLRDVLPSLVLGCEVSPLEASVLLPILPNIGRLLGREVLPAPELDPQLAESRLKHTLVDIVRRQDRPLLLILEDLHWADDTLDMIVPLIGLETNYPLVLLATYRSDEAPRLPERLEGMNPLLLARLAADEVQTLAEFMLADTTPTLIQFLLNQTEGNAFFIVDLLQTLAEDAGRLDNIGQLELSDALLSQGVLSVAERRLARVPVEYHRALRLAAVIGRELYPALITPADFRWIDYALETAILEVADGRLQFAHDRIREGILHLTDPAELRELHAEAAQALEQAFAHDPLYDAILARHWAAAQDETQELHYTLAAGQHAVRLNQFTAAQAYFERALVLLRDDDPRTVGAVEQLGKLYHTIGKFEDAQTLYKHLLALPHLEVKQRIEAMVTLADAMRRCGRPERAEALLIRAMQLADAYQDEQGKARALTAHAIIKLNDDAIDEALALLDQAVTLHTGGDAISEYEALRTQLAVHFAQGNILKIIELSEICLAKSSALGSANRIALDYNNLGVVNMLIQNYEQSRAYFAQAEALAREVGNTWVVALVQSNLTFNYIQAGDLEQALTYFARTVKIAHDYHIQHIISGTIFLAAMIKRLLEERVTAVAWMVVALAQPSLEPDVRRLCRLMLDATRADMPPEEYAQGLALGEALTVTEVYTRMRAELLPA